MSSWDYFFWYGSVFSPVLPLLLVLGKRLSPYQKVMVVFIVVSFTTDLLTTFIFKGNNALGLQAYGLLEAMILFVFYHLSLNKPGRWYYAIVGLFTVIYIADAIWIEPDKFNAIGRSVESVVMIFLALRLFYEFFRQEDDIFLERSPLFWFNIAILMYFTGAFFSFVLSSFILATKPLWILHNLSNMLKNGILAIGLWKVKAN